MKVESVLRRLSSLQIKRIGITIAALALLGIGKTIAGPAQIIDLNPNDSVNLSQLIGPSGSSVQVGDKLFSDFQFIPNNDSGNLANNMPTNAISVTALSNPFGYGISFSGPFSAIGDITKDVVLKYSVTVTDPTRLISDVHLSSIPAIQIPLSRTLSFFSNRASSCSSRRTLYSGVAAQAVRIALGSQSSIKTFQRSPNPALSS